MKEEIKNIFFDKATQEERDDFFFKLQEDLKNESELKDLMSPEEYEEFCNKED